MVDVVHEPIDDEQAEMHMWPPADSCGFGLEYAVPIHPIFWTLPIECKCHTLVEWSEFITFANSRVHWRGWLWIKEFKQSSSSTEGLPERGVSLLSKGSFLKWENYFLAVLAPMALSPYAAQMFPAASAAFAPLLNSKRNMSDMFQFHYLALHFLGSTAPLSILKWQNFNM